MAFMLNYNDHKTCSCTIKNHEMYNKSNTSHIYIYGNIISIKRNNSLKIRCNKKAQSVGTKHLKRCYVEIFNRTMFNRITGKRSRESPIPQK